MSKEAYYDMCKQMNTEPVEADSPIEYADLTNQSKDALNLFEYCSDKWDSTTGTYLGKDLNNLSILFGLLNIPEKYQLSVLNILNTIISYRVKSINRKNKVKKK